MSTIAHARSHALVHAWRGLVSGLAGGIVFGALMAGTGMLPMVGMLVGTENAVAGGAVHLVISAGFGVLFGLIAGAIADRPGPVLAAGAVYGLFWWVVGGLALMPAMLGMPLFQITANAWASLLGHLLYGLVTAAVLMWMSHKEV
ncbi:hypothetical protein O4J56_25095 [Nocardiopsis sp. RSe5-2]|uniref:DUF1440 domain-containing protein n=1 Tax=Nocardiopsis endophytica TaxID=3018445 RepID=A0ABT4UAH3_9ACTN|nr:hypothetical protein [Nocardiopsis endophytica]MDA2813946.1 hypothetical protein [Nocardiopsis endophytica]